MVNSKLDQLLDSIDPERTLDEVDRRADDAITSFGFESGRITDWSAYQKTLIRLLSHVDSKVLRLRSAVEMDPDFAWGRCVRILTSEYGTEGEKAAFEMARTGNEGGLYAVAKRFARRLARQYLDNEIKAKAGLFWDGLDVAEQLDVSSEYLSKYGHLLPSELTEDSAARLRANFPKVLAEHPRMIQKLQRASRR